MLATGAAVLVVAVSFALYQVFKVYLHLDAAGAAGALTGILALALLIGGLIFARMGRGPPKKEESPIDRAIEALKERPIVAAAAAVAATVIAIRNPAVVATVMASLLGPRNPPPR